MENMTSFATLNLDPNIAKALQACGYDKPTPIQANSIPEILAGKDLVASAQTGTGKTAAFVLPALHRLSQSKPINKPRILILTPTRELASQITEAAGKYGKFMNYKIVSLVGGMPYRQQLRDLSRPVDIIVATPGRLMDHMENQKIDLSQIEMLILDEADRMLDMGFIDDVKYISNKTPETRQTLLFSATVDSKLATVVRQLLKNPVRIDMAEETMSPQLITQELYHVDNAAHKNRLLQHFLDNGNIFKGIIFSATKINADNLANDLCAQGYSAAALHGDLKQNVRNRTVELLRRGKIQFLVATDIAARGIDISDVTHVINYDLPKFAEDYVHRIGRTGRAGKSGIAISFGSPIDVRHLQKIERYIGKRIHAHVIPGLEPVKGMKMGSGHSDKGGRKFSKDKGGYKSDHGSKSFRGKSSGDSKPFRGKSGGDDKPFRSRSNDDRPPFRSKSGGDDKPFRSRSNDDRPFRGKSSGDDKPFRSRSNDDRPFRAKSSGDDKPFRSRSNDDRPFRGKSSGDDKPFRSRSNDDRPFRAKSSGDDKPFRSRSNDDRPFRAKSSGDDKPFRSRSNDDRPFRGKSSGDDKPFRSRSNDDRPFRAKSSGDDKPFRSRSNDDRPFRAKSSGDDKPFRSRSNDDRPFRARSSGDDKPFRSRSNDDRPFRARTGDEKPTRSRTTGDKPFRARTGDEKPFRARTGSDKPSSRGKSFSAKTARPRVEGDKPFRGKVKDKGGDARRG